LLNRDSIDAVLGVAMMGTTPSWTTNPLGMVRKNAFVLAPFITPSLAIKTVSLPRQARDTHVTRTKLRKLRFSAGELLWLRAAGVGSDAYTRPNLS
jgi:hypothetical protein